MCVELSLKAVLRFIAIEYPRDHDVSSALEIAREKFPAWFSKKITEFMRISRDLSKKRGHAIYVMKPSRDRLLRYLAKRMQMKLWCAQKKFIVHVLS
jgi:HEPN domain-containing protein